MPFSSVFVVFFFTFECQIRLVTTHLRHKFKTINFKNARKFPEHWCSGFFKVRKNACLTWGVFPLWPPNPVNWGLSYIFVTISMTKFLRWFSSMQAIKFQYKKSHENVFTAKRILERRGIQTSSSFVKIWLVCFPESKANFLFVWHLHGLIFFI